MSAYDRIFIDIDTQFDFLDPQGKLYVPGSVEIYGALKLLMKYASTEKIPVFSSVDDHPPDAKEFAQFGPHCVRGSKGQKKLPFTMLNRALAISLDAELSENIVSLLDEYDQLIFSKDDLNVFTNPYFAELIDTLEVGEYIVFGVATDYCVFEEASGLLKKGKRVKIVRDAIRAIGQESGERAIRALTEIGAEWVDTSEVVRQVK